jgi:DNA-binding YbaB/EbfC family protein
MNQQALLKKVKKMQDEMVAAQQEIEETLFTASAGGVVTVEIYGTKEIENIIIADDFEVESKEDIEMLSEMIVTASKSCYKEIDKTTKEKMEKYNSLLGGMGGLF